MFAPVQPARLARRAERNRACRHNRTRAATGLRRGCGLHAAAQAGDHITDLSVRDRAATSQWRVTSGNWRVMRAAVQAAADSQVLAQRVFRRESFSSGKFFVGRVLKPLLVVISSAARNLLLSPAGTTDSSPGRKPWDG